MGENIDITKTGPQNWRTLQKINDMSLDEINDIASSLVLSPAAKIRGMASVAAPLTKDYTDIIGDTSWGKSKYDTPIIGYSDIDEEKINEIRALNQSGWEQIATGILKGAITTGTTYIDLLAGIPVGILTAVAEGRLSGIWDNIVTNAMQSVTDWSEEVLPNYYTKEQRESSWYEPVNLFSANFLGDKLIKNFGFSAGAGLGMKTISKLPKLLPKIASSQNVARAINTAETAFAGAVGEGSIEALNGTKDWANKQRAGIEYEKAQALSSLEDYYSKIAEEIQATYGNTELGVSSMQNLIVDYQKNVDRINIQADRKVRELQHQIDTQGNLILAGNIPILMGSNLLTLGKMIARGYNNTEHSIGKYIKQSVEDGKYVFKNTLTTPRQALRYAKTPFFEGIEEMNQAVISTAAGNRATDYFEMSVNPDKTEVTKNYLGYIWNALGQTYGDIDKYEEFVIGMLSSGISDIVVGQGKALREEKKSIDDAVSRANDVVNNFNNTSLLRYINRQQVLEDDKIRAAIENDKKEFKDAEFGQIASAVITFSEIGKIDELKAMIDYNLDNLSDEELNQLAESLSQKGVDDAEVNAFKLMSDEDKRNYLKKQKETYHTVIDKYNKVRDELVESTGNKFTPEQQAELIYYRLRADNAKERNDSIDKDIEKSLVEEQTKITPAIAKALGIEKEDGLPTAQEVVSAIKNYKGSNNKLADIFKGTPLEQKFKDKARLTEDIIKYNTTVMDFIANPQKLADKNEKIKEKVITAEQKKKARKIADRINWKGNAADILNTFNKNKAEIDEVGEDVFLESLTEKEKKALNQARQDNKIDKSFHESIDDSDLFASNKRKLKDAYDNSALKTPEERIQELKETVEELFKEPKEDGTEYAKEERDVIEQQLEKAFKVLSKFSDDVTDYREHIEKEQEYKPPIEETEEEFKPSEEEEEQMNPPSAEDTDEDITDFEYNPSNVEKYNRNSKRTRNHNRETSSTEYARPQISEYALQGIDNETYLDYIQEYPEAVPAFTDDTTIEDYRTYIEAVHTYLKEKGAFDYVKHHLKVGDKLEFFIDEELNSKAKQTVVLIRVAETGQVIGSLPTTIDFNSRTNIVTELDEKGEPTEWETSKQTLAERNPNRYKQYQEIVSKYNEDKKNGVDTNKAYASTTVEKLQAGDVSFSSRENRVKEVFEEGSTQPVLGVVVKEDEGSVIKLSKDIKYFSLQGRQTGQVYAFIPSNSGTYVPTLLWSTPIKDIISKGMDDPYIKELVEQIQEFTTTSRDERAAYKKNLRKSLRTPHGFDIELIKYENGKSVVVELIQEATAVRIQPNRGRKDEIEEEGATIKGNNSAIIMKLDENKELSDDVVLKALKILTSRFKGKQTITTGVDAEKLSDPKYIEFISDYLNFNVNQAHTVNDWFTYNMSIDKSAEVKKDAEKAEHNNPQESRVEIRDGKQVTVLPNGQIIQEDDKEDPLYPEPERKVDTKDTSDNIAPKIEIEKEKQEKLSNEERKEKAKQFIKGVVKGRYGADASINMEGNLPTFWKKGLEKYYENNETSAVKNNKLKEDYVEENLQIIRNYFNRVRQGLIANEDKASLYPTPQEASALNRGAQDAVTAQYIKQQIDGFYNSTNDVSSIKATNENKPQSQNVFGSSKLKNPKYETIGKPAAKNDKFFTPEQEEAPVSETHLYQDVAKLQKLLPNLHNIDRIVLVDNMIESADKEGNPIRVYAKYSEGILYIKKESPRGTAYHEAFHYVADWLLSKQDKELLFKEAFSRYNTTDELEAEEKLAEDFRKFMMGMTDRTLRGRIRRIFTRLKAFIDRISNNMDGIDILFWDIYSNRFSRKIQNDSLYENKLKAYIEKKYAYENLDEDTKEYLQERNFTKENYDKLSSKQKEYLLHCM